VSRLKTDESHKDPKNAKQIDRVRRICNLLPETFEKLSHGEPTFFVRKKVFAMFSNNHHNDGHVAVLIPAAIGIQAKLIEAAPKKFYRPAYVGVKGWVGIELNQVTDEELTLHIREGWKLMAPQKLQDSFEALNSGGGEPRITSGNEYVIPSRKLEKSRVHTTKTKTSGQVTRVKRRRR
jgi:hypothetical protein